MIASLAAVGLADIEGILTRREDHT